MNQNQTDPKPTSVEQSRDEGFDATICSVLEDALSVVPPHHSLACISQLNLNDRPWSFDVDNNGKPLITPESCKCSEAVKYLREALPANHPKGLSHNANVDAQQKADQEEWEWQMKMDKIEQNHDFTGERETEGEEE